jgi:hypothetical protein
LKTNIGLTNEERKTILKLLAFHTLEKSMVKNYKIRSLGRIKRLIKKKWKKMLPLIYEDQLVIESDSSPEEIKNVVDLLTLYSQLYTDLVDGQAGEKCQACIKKIKNLKILPSLNDELELEINRIIQIKPGPKLKKKKTVVIQPYIEFPHLNSNVRNRLVKYFKKRLKEEEPLVMLDSHLQLRINNFIRKHVDRIIDVFLEQSYKAIQYGYIGRSSEQLNTYVERKGMESIDWAIKNGVIIDELVKSIS